MATKNIFELLPDSDAEGETQQEGKKTVQKTDKKKDQKAPSNNQSQQKGKDTKPPGDIISSCSFISFPSSPKR